MHKKIRAYIRLSSAILPAVGAADPEPGCAAANGVQADRRGIETWRRLKGTNQLPKVIAGVRFKDGIEVNNVPANDAA
jgi:hypothetical protein